MENPTFTPAAGLSGKVSDYTTNVLHDVQHAAGVQWMLITSLERSPRDQARVMFRNLDCAGCPNHDHHGVAEQKRLYGQNGDLVIAEYVAGKALDLGAVAIIDRMERTIVRLGPSNVSHHCADSKVLQVVDVSPTSIPTSQLGPFIAAAKADHRISRVLTPADGDPAVHLEVPQVQPKLA